MIIRRFDGIVDDVVVADIVGLLVGATVGAVGFKVDLILGFKVGTIDGIIVEIIFGDA